MANIFVIACPQCRKQIKVSEAVVGKKIRCKDCGAAFPVAAPKAAPPRVKTKAEEKADKATEEAQEEADAQKGYAMAKDEVTVPRCPHCVKELESKDARICLHCGYNLITRARVQTVAVHEHTGGEKFQWLLPGILCVVGILTVITVSIICWVKTEHWMKDGWFHSVEEGKDKWTFFKPGCFQFFNFAVSAFSCYLLGRFAYRRLVLNNKPPEQIIQKGDADEDEDDEDEDEDED